MKLFMQMNGINMQGKFMKRTLEQPQMDGTLEKWMLKKFRPMISSE